MSKIQKALKALQQSHKDRGGEASPGDANVTANEMDAALVRDGKRPMSPQGKSDNRNFVSFDKPNEAKAKHNIDIDSIDLAAAGLRSTQKDAGVIGQQFRRIKRPIILAAFEADLVIGDNANVIMMASALPGVGKSFCAFNLTQSIAMERDVGAVLVDADVLKPGISRSFGLQDHLGLIDYLVDSSVQLEDILVQTDLNGVIVVPAGRKHAEATELLASRRMQELVSLLSETFKRRAIVFDMPPLLLTSEAQVLAANAGQIVMVIEARVSSQDSVMRALSMLDRQKPINAILNKSRSATGAGYLSDDYGYYSYSSPADGSE